jgi:tetratricopeptide (TPR) repeat protein
MKIKHIVLSASILVSVAAAAQKDELKALKKIYDKDTPSANDLALFKDNVTKLEALPLDEGQQIYLKYYKCVVPQIELASLGRPPQPADLQKLFTITAINEMADGYTAVLDYEKKTGKNVFTDDINSDITTMVPMMFSTAVEFGSAKKFKEASALMYAIYKFDPKDKDRLYYAASYAVNSQDYDKALDYYTQLKKLNYTGEGTLYWATNKASGAEENFPSASQRELYIKAGSHEKPRDEKLESKRGEIYKNIALILVQQGKTEEAKTAISDARKSNPKDETLALTEMDLYLKIKDYAEYTRLVNEALANNPTNTDLIYNLGVINAESGKLEDAEKYYKKALEIDPNYFNANLNLAELMLRADEKFVNEMNKLGTSEKDNKRYEVIKAEREKNFKAALPYLEKAVEIKGDDEAARKTLLSVYNALEMTDKAKALKAKK